MTTAAEIAADWIAFTRLDPASAPDDAFDRGWAIYEMAKHNPSVAWEAIQAVIESVQLSDLLSDTQTDAKKVVGNTAAGPLEDLLAWHGERFIDHIEVAARQDARMKWALSGVWQNAMPTEIWNRVQKAAR